MSGAGKMPGVGEPGDNLPSVTSHPFTKASADVVLRSSDAIEFRVHKIILAEASAFFDGMFSLPQPAANSARDTAGEKDSDGIPVIPVAEHSSVLDILLRYCYPIKDPTLARLTEVHATLHAAIKYEMTEATDLLKERLLTWTRASPLRVYTIACAHKLEDIALAAAKEVYRQKRELDFVAEMAASSAGEYSRLLQFCQNRGKLLPSHFFTDGGHRDWENQTLDPSLADSLMSTHPFNLPHADVIIWSADSLEFRVHRVILTMISPVFAEMIADLPPMTVTHATAVKADDASEITSMSEVVGSVDELGGVGKPAQNGEAGTSPGMDEANNTDEPGVDDDVASAPAHEYCQDLPIITVSENGRTVSMLLRLCYPLTSVDIDIQSFPSVFKAARKYKIAKALDVLEIRLTALMVEEPLGVYFLACRFGLQKIATEAARRSLGIPVDRIYRPEMETVSATTYYRLIQYHKQCTKAALGLTEDSGWLKSNGLDLLIAPCVLIKSHTRSDKLKDAPCWFSLLMGEAKPLLERMPVGTSVTDGSAFTSTINRLKSHRSPVGLDCTWCTGLFVVSDIHKSCTVLAKEVDEAVSRVQLQWG